MEVATDPMTAFTVFTDELDLWWVRGPINAYDSGRLVEMRCEPGVGGRILEVYDAESGDGLELARITVWEPGRRLAWKSSLDDVTIDVRFDPTATGTIVRLEATVAEGGEDRAARVRLGDARVVRRVDGASAKRRLARLATWRASLSPSTTPGRPPRRAGSPTRSASSRRAPCRRARTRSPTTSTASRGSSSRWATPRSIIEPLDGPPVDHAQVTHVPWVFVDDLEAHLARAREHGATIVQEIESLGYTSYVALDLEGRRWRFAQARPTQPR